MRIGPMTRPSRGEELPGTTTRAMEVLEQIPLFPLDVLEQELQRQDGGTRLQVGWLTLDQLVSSLSDQLNYQPTLQENSAFLLARARARAVSLALTDPSVVPELQQAVAHLLKLQQRRSEQKRKVAARQQEELQRDRQYRQVREGRLAQVRQMGRLLLRGQLVQQAALDADTSQAAVQLLVQYQEALETLHQQLATFGGTIKAATRLVREPQLTPVLPDDLLPQVRAALVEALAAESEEAATEQATQAIRVLIQREGTTPDAITPEVLAEAMREQARPTPWPVANLQQLLEQVAGAENLDGEVLWELVLEHLGGDAFELSPIVHHERQPRQEAGTFTFQVTPCGQAVEIDVQESGLTPATYTTPGPATRWSLLRVVTDLPLDGFKPVQAGAQTTDPSNPYILAPLAQGFVAPVSQQSGHVPEWDTVTAEEVPLS